jgi:hypothetical protein
MLKKKRESKFHGARSEKELRLQLAEIEKAARTAVAEDRLSASQTSSGGNLFGLNVKSCLLGSELVTEFNFCLSC